jgi:hypothetical protein
MNYYCTLFDSNYLTRGLAMYRSLIKTGEKFTLFVFAFDDLAMEILQKLSLKQIVVVSLQEFENDKLLAIKKTRTKGEYCWTCTSFTIKYILNHYPVDVVTYIDADLYFFDRPEILLQEFRNSKKDVMITKHRYTPEYDQSETSGIYCVQFMTFKNTEKALKVLNWWKDACAEWCFARLEAGRFGDQKYLDDWTERFEGIHVLEHLGGGVAPWNVQQYACTAGPKVNDINIVFYHFHGLKWAKVNVFDLGMYKLNPPDIRNIYYPYMDALTDALRMVREKYSNDFQSGINEAKACGAYASLRQIKVNISRRVRGCYNVIQR